MVGDDNAGCTCEITGVPVDVPDHLDKLIVALCNLSDPVIRRRIRILRRIAAIVFLVVQFNLAAFPFSFVSFIHRTTAFRQHLTEYRREPSQGRDG